jgi:hypothetical protein
MSAEELAEYEATIVVDAEDSDTDGEIVEVVIEEAATNCWVCTCGAENKGKFCPVCGKAKSAGILQYKCDKCGWVPDDKTHPPKFCLECGEPFDDGDIVFGITRKVTIITFMERPRRSRMAILHSPSHMHPSGCIERGIIKLVSMSLILDKLIIRLA